MSITVIIPCFNFENYIEQAILSALSQKTNFNVSIIVGDDNSTDRSLRLVENFHRSIEILKSDVNIGAQRNIKRLIDKCSTKYIAYLDGDDYWIDPHKLQKQVDFLEQNPEYIMTCTGYVDRNGHIFDPPSTHNWLCFPSRYENGEVTTKQLVDFHPAMYGRVFRRTESLIKDWMLNIHFFDWVTNYELSKIGKIKYLDFCSGVYRKHSTGTLSSLSTERIIYNTNLTKQILLEDYTMYSNSNQYL